MLTQDVVVKLILQHIGGAKLKPSTLLDVEGLPSMVRTAPLASLVTSLSQYGSTGQEIRDNLLKNPRAESANKVLSAIPAFEASVNNSTLSAPQKSIVLAAVEELETTVTDYLRHTNILSGKEVGDPLAEQSQEFIDLLDGIANSVSGTANAAWAAANAAWANAQAAFANAQSALDYALLATGAANLAGTYAVAANNSAASANSSSSAANGYAFLAAGHASSANTAAFQANLAAVSANSSAASANSSAILSANFAGQANSAAIVAQQFAADANSSAANAAASLIITAGHAVAANSSAAAAAANAVAAQGFAVSANSSAANAASQVTLAAGHAAAANSSAAASAANAVSAQSSAASANTSAASANSSAVLAAGFATAANGSATAAAANAVSAQSSATAANSSAASANTSSTLAASHVTSARLITASNLPGTFDSNGTFFTNGYNGEPSTLPVLADNADVNFVDVSGVGRVCEVVDTGTYDISNTGAIQVLPGRTYRSTFRYRTLTGTRSLDLYMITMTNWSYGIVAGNNTIVTATTTWQTTTLTVTGDAILAAGRTHIRSLGRASSGGSVVQWSIIGVEDITEQTISAAQATIANAAAASANSSAASANTNSTLSATYRADTIRINGNFGFDLGLENWFTGDNGTGPIAATGKYLIDSSVYGGSLRQNNNTTGSIFSGTLIPIDTSRKYRMRSRLHAWSSSGTTGATFYVGFVGCDANGNILDHGAYGSYRYSIWSGGAIAHNTHQSPSVIVTGEGNDSWLKFPPGTKFIRPMAIMNYFTENTYTWIDGIFIEDATESENAAAQATIAINAATSANSSAAAAQASMVLSASLSNNALNSNAGFDDYPSAAVGATPTGWNDGNFNSHVGYRVAGPNGGYSYRLPTSAGSDNYIGINYGNPGWQTVKQYDYFVLEAEATLNSGALTGAGVLLYMFEAGATVTEQHIIAFGSDKDQTNTVVGAGVAGKTYRFSKLVRAANANAFFMRIYAMSHWSTLGSIAAANDITWHKCSVRAATLTEIRDQAVLAPLEATVSTQGSAIANLTSATASYLLKTSAGSGTATLELRSTDSGNVVTSSITLIAKELKLGNSSSTVPTLAISNGVAQFTGELNVGTGSGARVNITKDLIRVYDANNVMRVRMGVW